MERLLYRAGTGLEVGPRLERVPRPIKPRVGRARLVHLLTQAGVVPRFYDPQPARHLALP